MQANQLNNSYDLNRALQWLSLNHTVLAWKCIDDAVTILIEPSEIDCEDILHGCEVKVKADNQLLEK